MAVIGSLSVKLGLVTVEWDKATADAKKKAKELKSAIDDLGLNMRSLKNAFNAVGGAAGLTVAGFAAMSRSVMDMSGQVDDLSKTYDVSIAKILQFQNAVIIAGGKAEDAGKMMGTMFSKVSEAQQGNEAAIASFEDLGITFEQLRAMNPEQTINRIFEGLAAIGNTADRIKATKEMLGKAGMQKSIKEISEALGESTVEFRRQEAALKAWADLGDRLDRTMINLKLAFADLFKSVAGADFVPSVNQFKAAMVAITSVAVVSGMFKLITAFRALNAALRTTASLSVAISAAGGIKGIAMAGAGLAAYFGAMKAFEGQDAKADAEGSDSEQEGGGTPESGKTGDRRVIAAGQAKLKLAKDLLDIDKRRHEYQMAYITGSQDELALGESALKYEEDIANAKQRRAEALKAENLSAAQRGLIAEEYNNAEKKASQERKQRDDLINAKRTLALDLQSREIQNLNDMAAIQQESARLENEKAHMSQWDYETAKENLSLQTKMLQLEQQRAELRAQWKGQEMSPEFVQGMEKLNAEEATERALSGIRQRGIQADKERAQNFEEGWKQAFEEFARDAENYGRAGAESFQALTGNMNAAIDNFVKTGKFAFKDFARSVIQDLIAIQLKMQAMSLLKMALGAFGFTLPGKAVGGAVAGGSPYMVGENGPELFIPQQSGSIVPNQRLGSDMNNQPQVVYNGPYIASMSAIDTQSAAQFLAKNKQSVWAANQSAQRGLPVSR